MPPDPGCSVLCSAQCTVPLLFSTIDNCGREGGAVALQYNRGPIFPSILFSIQQDSEGHFSCTGIAMKFFSIKTAFWWMVLCVHSSANTTTTGSRHFDNGVIYCRLRVTGHFDDQHASTRRNIVRPIQYKVQQLVSKSTMNFDQALVAIAQKLGAGGAASGSLSLTILTLHSDFSPSSSSDLLLYAGNTLL